MAHMETSYSADTMPMDAGVDSLGEPADLAQPSQSSTVDSTMALLTVPWALCTACLLAVLLYVNIHNFSVDGALRAAMRRDVIVTPPLTRHRDTARYVLLAVSLAVFLLHMGLSYFLFRYAYHILVSVSASLLDLSIMVEMMRKLHCGIFFFVDSVPRARQVEECGRYWVMEFSPYAEISAAEEALNAVSLGMSALPAESALHDSAAAAAAATSGSFSASGSFQRSFSQSLSLPPSQHPSQGAASAAQPRGNALRHPLADSMLSQPGRRGGGRPISPGLELSAGLLASSARSLSASTEVVSPRPRPFKLTVRRRHVALLRITFLSYRQLVQAEAEAEAVVDITNKFLSAVLLCVRRFDAHVVELFNDSAILSWNGFVESPGDYVHTCAQCGCWLYERFLHGLNEEVSGAFFNIACYAGHVVCGTTTEDGYVLDGRAVRVLRELPSLLEQRYCKYVWLGLGPPAVDLDGFGCVQWGRILADHNFALDLYAVGSPPDDAAWWQDERRPRLWHAPSWRLFGEEGAMTCDPHCSTPHEGAMVNAAAAAPAGADTGNSALAPAAPSVPGGGAFFAAGDAELFYDRNNILYQLSNTILGESKSCVVRLAISTNGTLVAVKEIKIERGDVSAMRRRRYQREKRIVVADGGELALMKEVRIMEQLHHICIVGYISFQETQNCLRIVMEYVGGGNLLQFVQQAKNAAGTDNVVGRPPIAVMLRSVLEGMAFLHRKGILHGDIKPQNVLVPDSGPCKLADFGISRRVTHAAAAVEGTPFYMAPEATRGEASTAADIWSFGIMMAEVLTGRLPYDRDVTDTYLIAQFMLGEDVERRLCTPLEPAAYDVFLACTQYAAADRKTANQLLQMPYFDKKQTTEVAAVSTH